MVANTLFSRYVRITIVVAAYWIVSIATVFINKQLLSSESVNLDAPLFVTWYQCITSATICCVLSSLAKRFPNRISFPNGDPFDRDVFKKVFPLSVLFTGMIATNNLCLKYVTVAFYYIGRSLTTIFNVVFCFLILGQRTSFLCIVCCLVIIGGFVLGIDQENITGSLSVKGTIFGVLGSLMLSLYSIYTKRVLPYVNEEIWLLSYYNNVYSVFLFIPLMIINGELPVIVDYPKLFEISFWFVMTIGGLCGFAIGFCTALQIKETSPLTHNISGTAKACAQTVLATYWFRESKTFLWWLSNMVVLFGSAGYARTKQLEMEASHKRMQNV